MVLTSGKIKKERVERERGKRGGERVYPRSVTVFEGEVDAQTPSSTDGFTSFLGTQRVDGLFSTN